MATALAIENQGLPLTPWSEFLREFQWKQGQHVSLIGPTGRGKTTLAKQILSRRDYVIAMGTKPRNKNLEDLRAQGYVRVRDLPSPPLELAPRVLFWPRSGSVEDIV